jgi:hypothetical protein
VYVPTFFVIVRDNVVKKRLSCFNTGLEGQKDGKKERKKEKQL